MSIITTETDMKVYNFPKEICSIISKYCSTFLVICIDILPDILPLLDCFTLHMAQHMTSETYNIISKYHKYNPKYTMLSDLIKYKNSGYIEIFNSLLQNNDVKTQLPDAFFSSIQHGNTKIVKMLLTSKEPILFKTRSRLFLLYTKTAIECNHPEIVKVLFEDKRFDITINREFEFDSRLILGDITKSVIDSLNKGYFKMFKLLEEKRIKLFSEFYLDSRENIIQDFLQKYPDISDLYKNLDI